MTHQISQRHEDSAKAHFLKIIEKIEDEDTTKLQSALAETERRWREEKRKAEYYRELAFQRWEKLQEVQRGG